VFLLPLVVFRSQVTDAVDFTANSSNDFKQYNITSGSLWLDLY
jgi:hypothetical protein